MLLRFLFICFSSLLLGCATASSGADSGPGQNGDGDPNAADADPLTRPDADTCPGDPCQIAPQCGCSGQACDLDFTDLANGSTACRDVTVPGEESSSCDSATACAGGFVCLGSQCRAYCNDASPCGAGLCVVQPVYDSGGSVFEPIPGVTACSKSCAPEQSTGNGCPSVPQFGCHLVNHDPDGVAGNGDEFYYSDCRTSPATGGGDGAACPGGDPECRSGYECVGLNDEPVCKQLCIVPGGACTIGTCTALTEGVVIDGVEYGVCL